MTNVIELAKQAGFHFWDAGFADKGILHTTGDKFSQMCFERFATLVRNAALDEAAQYCHDASIPQPDQIHTDAQWAAACLAVNLRNLKEPTP